MNGRKARHQRRVWSFRDWALRSGEHACVGPHLTSSCHFCRAVV